MCALVTRTDAITAKARDEAQQNECSNEANAMSSLTLAITKGRGRGRTMQTMACAHHQPSRLDAANLTTSMPVCRDTNQPQPTESLKGTMRLPGASGLDAPRPRPRPDFVLGTRFRRNMAIRDFARTGKSHPCTL
jgi:hypothetical protein